MSRFVDRHRICSVKLLILDEVHELSMILNLQYNINKRSFFLIVLLHHSEDFIYRSLSSKMEKYFSRHSFQSLQC